PAECTRHSAISSASWTAFLIAVITLSRLTIFPLLMPRLRAVAIPITWILSGACTLPIKTETLCVPMSIATTEGTASLIIHYYHYVFVRFMALNASIFYSRSLWLYCYLILNARVINGYNKMSIYNFRRN